LSSGKKSYFRAGDLAAFDISEKERKKTDRKSVIVLYH
jgi:hypothetical protein